MRIGVWNSKKPLRLHAGAQRIDDLAAQHDVAVKLFAAQVEEAVAQPHILGIGLVAEDRHGQFGGGAEHLDLGDIDLDEAGRHFGVFGAGGAFADGPVDAHDPFGAQFLGEGERPGIGVDDALRDAVMVAQVDEQNAAVIADAVAPAGQPDRFAGVGFAEVAAAMGTVAVHVLVKPLDHDDFGPNSIQNHER